jgi:hypothetical protein
MSGMPLSSIAARQHIHTRSVDCRGYLREDGLWDIEGHLVDVKTYDFASHQRGEVAAGDPVHDMWLRLTIDDSLTIRAVEAVTDKSPFRVCPEITPNFERLVGLNIGPGFHARVRALVGRAEGCTHLVELLWPLATTAFQTIYPWKERQMALNGETNTPAGRPRLLDTCHAFASDGPLVKQLWPDHYTGG